MKLKLTLDCALTSPQVVVINQADLLALRILFNHPLAPARFNSATAKIQACTRSVPKSLNVFNTRVARLASMENVG